MEYKTNAYAHTLPPSEAIAISIIFRLFNRTEFHELAFGTKISKQCIEWVETFQMSISPFSRGKAEEFEAEDLQIPHYVDVIELFSNAYNSSNIEN